MPRCGRRARDPLSALRADWQRPFLQREAPQRLGYVGLLSRYGPGRTASGRNWTLRPLQDRRRWSERPARFLKEHPTVTSAVRPRDLLREGHGHAHSLVTFVELFFDLVFVFAVTQLSHGLLERFTPRGGLETAMLLMAVWWVWIYTSWFTNWLDPERIPVRLVLFALMLAGLILSASIPRAFESKGIVFGATYAATQVGRTLFILWAVRHRDALRRNFQRIQCWLVVSAIFWILGGLAAGNARLGLWAFALFLEYLAPACGFWTPGLGRSAVTDWNISGEHMAERCGLFVIIALGESILVTGATFSGLTWNPATVAAFVTAFLGSAAMWWLYFNATASLSSTIIARSRDPGRLGRLAYTYIHIVIVAGIVVSAVGDELSVAHPSGQARPGTWLALAGGPMLFLLGILLFKWSVFRKLSLPKSLGIRHSPRSGRFMPRFRRSRWPRPPCSFSSPSAPGRQLS